jgi:hypothetical protein
MPFDLAQRVGFRISGAYLTLTAEAQRFSFFSLCGEIEIKAITSESCLTARANRVKILSS